MVVTPCGKEIIISARPTTFHCCDRSTVPSQETESERSLEDFSNVADIIPKLQQKNTQRHNNSDYWQSLRNNRCSNWHGKSHRQDLAPLAARSLCNGLDVRSWMSNAFLSLYQIVSASCKCHGSAIGSKSTSFLRLP